MTDLDASIVGVSIPAFIAQSTGAQADNHGFTKLGRINDVVPLEAPPTATISNNMYNVVPNSQLGAGTVTNQVFVGLNSQICTNTDTIKRFGFALNANCGSTSIQTPP